jgi:hypothetical protein
VKCPRRQARARRVGGAKELNGLAVAASSWHPVTAAMCLFQ